MSCGLHYYWERISSGYIIIQNEYLMTFIIIENVYLVASIIIKNEYLVAIIIMQNEYLVASIIQNEYLVAPIIIVIKYLTTFIVIHIEYLVALIFKPRWKMIILSLVYQMICYIFKITHPLRFIRQKWSRPWTAVLTSTRWVTIALTICPKKSRTHAPVSQCTGLTRQGAQLQLQCQWLQ